MAAFRGMDKVFSDRQLPSKSAHTRPWHTVTSSHCTSYLPNAIHHALQRSIRRRLLESGFRRIHPRLVIGPPLIGIIRQAIEAHFARVRPHALDLIMARHLFRVDQPSPDAPFQARRALDVAILAVFEVTRVRFPEAEFVVRVGVGEVELVVVCCVWGWCCPVCQFPASTELMCKSFGSRGKKKTKCQNLYQTHDFLCSHPTVDRSRRGRSAGAKGTV